MGVEVRHTPMALLHHRRDRIDRIERRIGRLGKQSAKLLQREQELLSTLEDSQRSAEQPTRRLRQARATRALTRTERQLVDLRAKRGQLAEAEIRTIMLALQGESQRTRERLDRALERLSPVQLEWERLRATFDTLEAAVAMPALEQLAGQWQGMLEIPEFPIREREGYARPFPQRAVVF
jgi:hypothetical protein